MMIQTATRYMWDHKCYHHYLCISQLSRPFIQPPLKHVAIESLQFHRSPYTPEDLGRNRSFTLHGSIIRYCTIQLCALAITSRPKSLYIDHLDMSHVSLMDFIALLRATSITNLHLQLPFNMTAIAISCDMLASCVDLDQMSSISLHFYRLIDAQFITDDILLRLIDNRRRWTASFKDCAITGNGLYLFVQVSIRFVYMLHPGQTHLNLYDLCQII